MNMQYMDRIGGAMQTKRILLTTVLALGLILAGCSGADQNTNDQAQAASTSQQTQNQDGTSEEEGGKSSEEDSKNISDSNLEETIEETAGKTSEESSEKVTDESPAEQAGQSQEGQNQENTQAFKRLTPEEIQTIQPNEMGEVMIVMYHGLGKKNSAYVRTPESFRQDLETYYEMGFRPVNLSDYVEGNIDTPAGLTPIVLTFDDGNNSNFNLIEENGELIIDPNCALGIILDFNKTHPDWALKGSFFLNGGTPFGQKDHVDYKVNWLVDNGFEVGNHSYGHEDLTEQDGASIQRTLGKNIQEIEARLDGYTVNTLALPFGKRPKDQERYDLVTAGSFEGVAYEHKAILLVGWKPEVSVYDKAFNPLAIMRVQSGDGDFQMIHWLEDYRNNPHKRFISDGNPETITVPQKEVGSVDVEKFSDKEVIEYTVSETE